MDGFELSGEDSHGLTESERAKGQRSQPERVMIDRTAQPVGRLDSRASRKIARCKHREGAQKRQDCRKDEQPGQIRDVAPAPRPRPDPSDNPKSGSVIAIDRVITAAYDQAENAAVRQELRRSRDFALLKRLPILAVFAERPGRLGVVLPEQHDQVGAPEQLLLIGGELGRISGGSKSRPVFLDEP